MTKPLLQVFGETRTSEVGPITQMLWWEQREDVVPGLLARAGMVRGVSI